MFCLYVCPAVLSCSNLKLHQTLEVKDIFNQEKIMLQLTLNAGLTFTGFRTTRPRKFKTSVPHINSGPCTRVAFLRVQLSQDFKVSNGEPLIRKISVKIKRCLFEMKAYNFGHLVVQLSSFEIQRKSRIDVWSQ